MLALLLLPLLFCCHPEGDLLFAFVFAIARPIENLHGLSNSSSITKPPISKPSQFRAIIPHGQTNRPLP
jgi:hypothetical protein